MISLFHVLFKIVKWALIAAAYVLLGLAKLVTILVVLAIVATRGGIRRLLDAKERRAAIEDPDEYDLGYPPPGPSRDAFDARWQRERDLRVAERQALRPGDREARVVSSRSEAGGQRRPG